MADGRPFLGAYSMPTDGLPVQTRRALSFPRDIAGPKSRAPLVIGATHPFFSLTRERNR